jgi:hypothetical protein
MERSKLAAPILGLMEYLALIDLAKLTQWQIMHMEFAQAAEGAVFTQAILGCGLYLLWFASKRSRAAAILLFFAIGAEIIATLALLRLQELAVIDIHLPHYGFPYWTGYLLVIAATCGVAGWVIELEWRKLAKQVLRSIPLAALHLEDPVTEYLIGKKEPRPGNYSGAERRKRA